MRCDINIHKLVIFFIFLTRSLDVVEIELDPELRKKHSYYDESIHSEKGSNEKSKRRKKNIEVP